MLTVVAGRVDGSAERPQLLPLEELSIDLYRGDRRLGRLALVRDLLPGRYSFGITGRGVNGRRLPPGEYELRLTATPVGGGDADEETVPFTIRSDSLPAPQRCRAEQIPIAAVACARRARRRRPAPAV